MTPTGGKSMTNLDVCSLQSRISCLPTAPTAKWSINNPDKCHFGCSPTLSQLSACYGETRPRCGSSPNFMSLATLKDWGDRRTVTSFQYCENNSHRVLLTENRRTNVVLLSFQRRQIRVVLQLFHAFCRYPRTAWFSQRTCKGFRAIWTNGAWTCLAKSKAESRDVWRVFVEKRKYIELENSVQMWNRNINMRL